MSMSAVHFSNYRLEDGVDYFLYIGELKNYGLNPFLQEALSRYHNRPFKFIAIVPDLFEQYNYDNIMVINPLKDSYECHYQTSVSCRVSAREFAAEVSKNPEVRELIDRLLTRQSRAFLYMYESLAEMTLDEISGVSILGPDKAVANRLNSKTYQAINLEGRIPMVECRVCQDLASLIGTTADLWDVWKDGIFVTREYSAAGINSMVTHSQDEVLHRFGSTEGPFMISRYMPHTCDPTVLGVVAGENDVFIAGVADQRIEGGNRFTGSTFPTVLAESQVAQLKEHTREVGRWMASEGYRGIFGCDFIVTDDGRILFLEINARKQGTTLEFCCTLEQNLPPGAPILPELEMYAVLHRAFPAHTVEMDANPRNIHWGTYNYKIHNTVRTTSYVPQSSFERQAFRRVAEGNLKKDYLILEHAGSDFVIAQGSFIARIVALGHDHASVGQGLDLGRKTIDLTIETLTVTGEMS